MMSTQHTVDDDFPVVYLFTLLPYPPHLICRAFYLLPLCLVLLQLSHWDRTLQPITVHDACVPLPQ